MAEWDLLRPDHTVVLRNRGSVLRQSCYPGMTAVVTSGCASKIRTDTRGRVQVLGFFTAGAPLMHSGGARGYDIGHVGNCELALFNSDRWDFFRSPKTREWLARSASLELAAAQQWLFVLTKCSALERVIHVLCEVGERLGLANRTDILFPLTQQQIANITSQSPVNVNRVLARLEEQQCLERRGKFRITNWERLRAMVCFDPGFLYA